MSEAARRFEDLAQLFCYPWGCAALHAAAARLFDSGYGSLSGLLAFLASSSLGAVQEEFVARFDIGPACAPYLGHHLYGEHLRRGEYLLRLKELYREHAFRVPAIEPPDHLATMLRFAAHLARHAGDAPYREFLSGYLLEGVRRLLRAAEAQDGFPWTGAVAAASALCEAECEEEFPCSTPSSS